MFTPAKFFQGSQPFLSKTRAWLSGAAYDTLLAIRQILKKLARDKRSSLFSHSVGDGEKKFYKWTLGDGASRSRTDTPGTNAIKLFGCNELLGIACNCAVA